MIIDLRVQLKITSEMTNFDYYLFISPLIFTKYQRSAQR